MIKISSERQAELKKKKIAKNNRILGITKSTEPVIDPDNYKISLVRALNQYNIDFDSKTKKQWLLTHFKADKEICKAIAKMDDVCYISTMGVLARLLYREQPLSDLDRDKLKNLRIPDDVAPTEPKAVPKVGIQDRLLEKLHDVYEDFEVAVDNYFQTKTSFDTTSYLKSNNVSPLFAKKVSEYYKPLFNELDEAYLKKDADLVEAYSFMSRVEHRKAIEFVQSIINGCVQYSVSQKVNRTPRARKPKAPSVIVKAVKYLKEFGDLRSTNPVEMVDSKEIWVFNVKTRTLQVYRADDFGKLTVKGSSIVGYDIGLSQQKTIRKPEMLGAFIKLTRAKMRDEFKAIKAVDKGVNGRMNEHTIILKVVK